MGMVMMRTPPQIFAPDLTLETRAYTHTKNLLQTLDSLNYLVSVHPNRPLLDPHRRPQRAHRSAASIPSHACVRRRRRFPGALQSERGYSQSEVCRASSRQKLALRIPPYRSSSCRPLLGARGTPSDNQRLVLPRSASESPGAVIPK